MARKQIGIKLEEEDLARWDAFAESQGWTRTTLIETAIERLIGTGEAQVPGKTEEAPKHAARPGIRRAFICAHEKCVPPRRIFLRDEPADFVPECPEHGRMVPQPNRPYFGQSTA